MRRGTRRSPSAALSYAFNVLTKRLWGGGCDVEDGELEIPEPGTSVASRLLTAKANTKVSRSLPFILEAQASLAAVYKIRLHC